MLGTRGVPNAYGGFEQAVEHLGPRLNEQGHDVHIYCSTGQAERLESWEGCQLHYCFDPTSLGTFGQFIYDLNCIRHARRQAYDVVIQFGYTSSSIWWWLWPEAPHLVNMDGLEFKRSKYSSLVQGFLRYAERLATREASILIADNPGIEEYLTERYPSSQVRMIAYGTSLPSLPTPTQPVLDMGLYPNAYDLVICRMEPENHVELICKAHSSSEDPIPLVLVGSTENGYGRLMKQRFGSEGIRFVGSLYDREKLDALRGHCLHYIHGHSVGGTNPSLLEAMAAAQSIIAHDNPFNRSVLQDEGEYFLDESSLRDALQKKSSPDSLSKNRARLTKDYNWEYIADQYMNACYEALG